MALTLNAEQKLASVGLIAFFGEHEEIWLKAARETRTYVVANFPPGSLIRRDDVAKAFISILEVNELLKDELSSSKLRQKFWIRDFADLIIDRTWDRINGEKNDEERADDH
jgi:hypothetical protein